MQLISKKLYNFDVLIRRIKLKTILIKSLCSIFTATVAISFTASATSFIPTEDMEMDKVVSKVLFKKVDSNKDDKVSFEEVFQYRIEEDERQAVSSVNDFFKRCDKNNDGKVGGDELVKVNLETYMPEIADDGCTAPVEMLDMVDFNMDGFITREEILSTAGRYGKPPPKMRKKLEAQQSKRKRKQELERFKGCDKSKDQFLSFREAASMECGMYTEIFDLRDKDGDQLISQEEMLLVIEEPAFPVEPMLIEDKSKMLPLDVLLGAFYRCDENENEKLELSETVSKSCEVDMVFFNSVDFNADGAVDEKEMNKKRMKQSFDKMDADNNGYLSIKEFKANQIRYL